MKKLMIVALAVASCSAFAGDKPEKGDLTPDKIKTGVYTLSFTQKGLEYVTKKYSEKSASSKKFYGDDADEATENAKLDAEEAFADIIVSFNERGLWIDEESLNVTTKKAARCTKTADKLLGKYVCSGWTVTYTAQAVSSKKVPTSKVVSRTVSGLYVSGYGEKMDGAYLWDPKVKTSYFNTHVDKKGRAVKLATATKENLEPTSTEVSEDGKASMVLQWDSLQAVGTGTTAIKDEDGAFAYVKSIAGNAVDPDLVTYGTWKFSPDSKSTGYADKGMSIEEILAKKKVELAQ